MLEIDGLRLIEPARYAEHGYPYEEWALLRREAPLTQIEPPG